MGESISSHRTCYSLTKQDKTEVYRQGGTNQNSAGRQASRQDNRVLKADQLTILTYPASQGRRGRVQSGLTYPTPHRHIVTHGQVHLVDPPLQSHNLLLILPVAVEVRRHEEGQNQKDTQGDGDRLLVTMPTRKTLAVIKSTLRLISDGNHYGRGFQGGILVRGVI